MESISYDAWSPEKFSTPPSNTTTNYKSWSEIKSSTRRSISLSATKKKTPAASGNKKRNSIIDENDRRRSYNTSIICNKTTSTTTTTATMIMMSTNTHANDAPLSTTTPTILNNHLVKSQQKNCDDRENIPPENHHRIFEFGIDYCGVSVIQSQKIANLSQSSTTSSSMQLNGDNVNVCSPKETGFDGGLASVVTTKAQKMTDQIVEMKTPHKQNIPSRLMDKLNQDLNSPSASAQMRARNALKSPTRLLETYDHFDVTHGDVDFLTEEERRPIEPKTFQEIMKDVIVYVEVKSGKEKRTDAIKAVITGFGVKINERFYRSTTHVIFKEGTLSTYKKAIQWNIPVVSLLWMEGCRRLMCVCNPKHYPISNLHQYEHPELYRKNKYSYSNLNVDELIQENIKKYNEKMGTNLKAITSTEPNNRMNSENIGVRSRDESDDDDDDVFQPKNNNKTGGEKLDCSLKSQDQKQKEKKTLNTSAAPANAHASLSFFHKKSEEKLSQEDKVDVDPLPLSSSSNESNVFEVSPPKSSDRRSERRTTIHNYRTMTLSDCKPSSSSSVTKSDVGIFKTPVTKPPMPVERRRTIFTPQPMDISRSTTMKFSTPQPKQILDKHNVRELIAKFNVSNYTPKGIVDDSFEVGLRRETTYSPKLMNDSDAGSLLHHTHHQQSPRDLIKRRQTMFTPHSIEEVTPKQLDSNNRVNRRRTLFTPRPFVLEEEVDTPKVSPSLPLFNTKKKKSNDNRRKTMYELPTPKFDLKEEGVATPKKINSDENENETQLSSLHTDINLPPQQSQPIITGSNNIDGILDDCKTKKRKLFNPAGTFKLGDYLESPKKKICTPKKKEVVIKELSKADNLLPEMLKMKLNETPIKSQMKETLKRTASRRSSIYFEPKAEATSRRLPMKGLPTTSGVAGASTITQRKGVIAITNLDPEQHQRVKEAITKLGHFELKEMVTDRTTHVITSEPRRTFNILRGLIRGLWILNYEWIDESLKSGHWLFEEPYECRKFSRAVEICRSERQAFGSSYKIDLFVDLPPFFVSIKSTVPYKNVRELILLCRGKVTNHLSKAKYVIGGYEESAALDAVCLSPLWVLDSITENTLKKIGKYMIVE